MYKYGLDICGKEVVGMMEEAREERRHDWRSQGPVGGGRSVELAKGRMKRGREKSRHLLAITRPTEGNERRKRILSQLRPWIIARPQLLFGRQRKAFFFLDSRHCADIYLPSGHPVSVSTCRLLPPTFSQPGSPISSFFCEAMLLAC